MSDTIYLCVARLDGIERVFLWSSGDDAPDQIVTDDSGKVLAFENPRAARNAAHLANWVVSPEEPTLYDFDAIVSWCRSDAEIQDCSSLLKAWNILADLPGKGSLFGAADERAKSIYDKLFWGSNLPAVTPPGERFIPRWSHSETADLKRLLLLGVTEFRAAFF